MGSIGAARNNGDTTTQSFSSIQEQVSSSPDYVGDRSVEEQIDDQLRYNLPMGAEYARVDSFTIVSNPGGGEFGDVEAQYTVEYSIPVTQTDADGYTWTDYERESETVYSTFQVRLKNR